VLVWVPTEQVAEAVAGLAGVQTEIVNLDQAAADGDTGLPASAAKVQFCVLPFFPQEPALAGLAALPELRVVQTQIVGIDRIRPWVPAGVTLCNARGAHDAGTAEWVVGAMLASIREFPFFAAEQRAARWSQKFTGALAGRRVLIVGYGSIGAALERRLDGFEVEIRRVARRARDGVSAIADVAGLLPWADVVVLLAPVTSETIGMVDAAFLAAMKDGALFVNGARGVLVDQRALEAELTAGRLSAALDVTDPEPLDADSPLWARPNVFLTPHIAGSTPASVRSSLALIRAQIERFCAGEPLLNMITGEY
jgi:phosphoglycerate dehydrogenase-like enzyme